MKIIFKYLIPLLGLLLFIILILTDSLKINVSLFANILTIGLTYFYVLFTWEMVSSMKIDSQLERRPYIVPDFFVQDHSYLIFAIKNYGRTPAFKVKVKISPDIELYGKLISDSLFALPISIMPPNREIKTIIGFSKKIFQNANYCKEYVVFIEYTDMQGQKIYENFSLNLDYLRHEIYAPRKGVHDIALGIEKLNEKLGKDQ
jgi:hypothetical protein